MSRGKRGKARQQRQHEQEVFGPVLAGIIQRRKQDEWDLMRRDHYLRNDPRAYSLVDDLAEMTEEVTILDLTGGRELSPEDDPWFPDDDDFVPDVGERVTSSGSVLRIVR